MCAAFHKTFITLVTLLILGNGSISDIFCLFINMDTENIRGEIALKGHSSKDLILQIEEIENQSDYFEEL